MKTVLRFILFAFLFVSFTGIAQTFPANFSRELVDNGLTSPTSFAFAPDGRIFVTQQTGAVRVIKEGSLLSAPAITLTVTSTQERGLLGIAVDPDFTNNNYVYLYYTVPAGTERTAAFNKIVRYTFEGDVIDASSVTQVLALNDLSSATNHNGGALNFGPDGKLYVGVGENATRANAQNLDNYLGKILRINSDGSVPEGNPFTGNDAKSRIWAYGLRNPYTFTFDQITGALYVNDVGENTWEEVNNATQPGLNFGWPSQEGVCSSGCTGFTDPVFVYNHGVSGTADDNVTGCSIIGGTLFNPATTTYPASYRGKYFFSEFCKAWINYFDPQNPSTPQTSFGTSVGGQQTYLLTGPDGNLYYTSRSDGALYKITYNSGGAAPVITIQPEDVTVTAGTPAAFSVAVSGTGPFTYQWKKNNVTITGSLSTYSILNPSEADEGAYSVLVSNAFGSSLSEVGVLTVETPTALLDPAKDNALSVVPNPSSGKVRIQYPLKGNDRVTVTVRNAQGESLIQERSLLLSEELDLSAYPAGLYFLQIDGYGVKLVKE